MKQFENVASDRSQVLNTYIDLILKESVMKKATSLQTFDSSVSSQRQNNSTELVFSAPIY